MATFTITSPTNIDSLVGRTGGDTYTINGGALIIDEDSRYGLNANTSAIIGTVTPSAALGGSMFVDGRAIWLIPYTGGTGNVPAYNTTISNGAASGLLIGVHSSINAAPTTPGSAMPSTGWIRVKQWNFNLYGTGALTGIGATASAGEKVGFIIPVGQEGTLCLISSLNQTYGDGSFAKGDWYEVGTTDGNRATTYQVPSNGELCYHGGFMVDKAPATAITAATWSAGVLTVTSPSHGLSTDDRVFIDGGISPRTFRTVETQRITRLNANQFTLPMATNPGTYVSGGTVAAQEWYPTTETVNTKVGTEAYRGKFCWLDPTTAQLRFGNDGTTSTGGYCPPAGLVVRMPNIMTANAKSASRTVNSLAAAPASRWRYYNGNAGTIKATHLSGSWGPSVFQTGKLLQLADITGISLFSVASQSNPCTFSNICMGGNAAATFTNALSTSGMIAASTFLDCCFSVGEIGARYPFAMSGTYDITFDKCRFVGTGDRTSATYTVNASIGSRATFTRCDFGGQGLITSSQFSNISMSYCSYYSIAYGDIGLIATPTATIDLKNLSLNCSFENFTLYGKNPLSRTSLLSAASNSDGPTIRNWGTAASPIDMRINGTKYWASWTRSGTTATVTENGHPYRVNDAIVVFSSSSGAAITASTKTVTAVTANTFSFTCLNAGATSGVLSYYASALSSIVVTTATANITLQNVHIRGHFSTPISSANTNYGMTLDNVTGDAKIYNLLPIFAAHNTKVRSLYEGDYAVYGQQSAVFGTHFSDVFVREPGSAVPGQAAPVTGVSWSRVTTTCTVTSPNHGLQGASQRIWIENSSNTTGIQNTWGATAITINILDKDTFTFSCGNGGATSGTLDYRLAGDSQYRIMMNEPSTATVGQAEITASSGAAGFTGAGSLALPAVGDQCTWTHPDFIKGYEGFAYTPAIPYGNVISNFAQLQAFDIQYQRDDGAGFGPWKNAALWRGAAGASGANSISVTDSSLVQVGDCAYAASGVPTGTTVTAKQTGKLTMLGSASSASAPDSAALQLTSSLTIGVKLNMSNWAPGSAMCLVAKGDSSTLTKGYYFRVISTGELSLAIGLGSSAVSATSSASLSTVLTNGVEAQVRAVWDQAASECKFFWRLLDSDPWTQLGTTQTLTGASIGTSASTFFIGQRTTGNDYFTGEISRVRVYSDATQTTKVFDADWAGHDGSATLIDSVNGAVVTTVASQAVTLSNNNTAAVASPAVFWNTPNEPPFLSTGVRLKVRMTANQANTAAAYQIDFPLLSSATSRARLYPQTKPVTVSITAVDENRAPVQNARVYIKADTGGPETAGTVLLTGVTNSSGVLTGTYGFSSDQPITGWVRKATGSPTYKQAQAGGTIESSGFETTVFLVKDE